MQFSTRPWVRLFAASLALLLALSVSGPVYADDTVHTVAPGENLTLIARRYGLTLQELLAYNGIVNPNIVFVGQQIEIPSSGYAPQTLTPALEELPGTDGYYVVGRGDTLSQVAKAHGMTTADLLRLNGLTNANIIWVGQTLRLSARATPVIQESERVPEPHVAESIYVVQPGDTLAGIAADYETTTQALLIANGLPNPNFVYVGQRLRLHAGFGGKHLEPGCCAA